MSGRRLRTRKQLTPPVSPAPAVSTRPRRGTVNRAAPTTIERSSPDETRVSSIRLTVKSDPKKLKEATSGSSPVSKKQGAINSRDSFTGGQIVTGARSTRKKAIIESESSEEAEEDEEEEQEDFDEEDAEGEEDEDADADGDEEDEEMADDDEEEEEEEEDAEGEEDELMEDAPPVVPKGRAVPKPQVTVTPAKALPSVEDKEMAMDEDEDEELSDLSDEDLDGGEDELGGAGVDDDDEDESDEDISRSETPDLSKLTRRQRQEAAGLMALSNEAQKKKHFTAEEMSNRRLEMARRRKALSEKRNDEEKQDTINRLLKRQASKRQRKADVEADRIAEEGEDETIRPSKVYARYVQTTRGAALGVPQEWVDAGYVGGVFGEDGPKKTGTRWSGRMVEIVE